MHIGSGGVKVFDNRFSSAVDMEFVVHALNISANGAYAEIQLGGDLLIRKAFSQ